MDQRHEEKEKQISARTLGRRTRLNGSLITIVCLTLIPALTVLSPAVRTAMSSEGGDSSYPPGTYGDFGMNILPTGLSLRENIFYVYGHIDQYPTLIPDTTIPITPDLDLTAWVNLLQVVYATNHKILGGRYFASLDIPVDLNLEVDVHLGTFSEESNVSGLDDIRIIPLGLLWDRHNLHFLAAENIIAPVGSYDANKVANPGRNYWTFDTIFGLTWLDPRGGHQISFTAGYGLNTENDDTHYKTGNEFHLDYIMAQYFSPKFGVGMVGYYYKQITADSGSGYDTLNAAFSGRLNGYKGTGAGVGPAVLWGPEIAGHSVDIVGKWLYEYQGDNRFKGGWAFISASITL